MKFCPSQGPEALFDEGGGVCFSAFNIFQLSDAKSEDHDHTSFDATPRGDCSFGSLSLVVPYAVVFGDVDLSFSCEEKRLARLSNYCNLHVFYGWILREFAIAIGCDDLGATASRATRIANKEPHAYVH